jgi:tRNA G10  N-methylase Trm11
MPDPEIPDPDLLEARSIWLTGQTCSREQRRGRYTPESMTHPGKMIPAIARYLIHTFTDPGDLVLDPMAGIGTTVIEAMHADRCGVGVEYEHRWAELAAANLAHATRRGATGLGEVYRGDSRRLPELLPERHAGRVKLVITSPPYGDSTHGHVRTPGTSTGKVRKVHHRYGDDGGNLAYRDHAELADGFADILTGCRNVLHPDGIIAVTARPYRRYGDLIDIPAMVIGAGKTARLELLDRCYPLIAGVRDGRVIARGSFFQLHNIRTAEADGDPQWLVSAEDLIVFGAPGSNG